ncbi:bifunctional indole-3-glycerol-phosphate synthase TrpC/phosphoribosylanthranilate isomerase TrpF [Vibrio cincinnatiensis]|jgi:indole-3-glycerol phosphate synthase/phosphoribosylanthranilate isomerase|uniref:Multifunctional fusion protein n=1 Tax=Vibrio cincinnatiensis DSM 19608 TaxID=1123491 RepID=A0A1T4KCS7_VIBCI|nr:bifunctional indole-3-glycerol-phosphate synthase TrpC/phosphoribosylanthranilate isomerase TrpF [Vibrio cincinnatiensis]MCG3721923.1 bifunctional indole-3-glycerol-phosphate synthase TrpC/phosphoribosylanthranilate isomerase TrpF [Vibrio cincinnatiensis]MCG3731263.1 bifunctional indole-3-glycerol-phosphate synthase TrpC/phosphoribosylanthranilate isomerase TrpF [Vibrio cincinnatiensis]MCG3735015.1 bifunctional indole-3-glycerol-phosphate synthase TrpC/phosphoribosylanthranilate isomerase Trp
MSEHDVSQQLSEHISLKHTQMAEVLAKIVGDKAVWVAERKLAQPLDTFQSLLSKTDRDFYQALNQSKTVFILECKKASPSKGLIRDSFDLDYIASVYHQYADAISVLTDEKYFQGNFDFIARVRAQVSQPVLCKDFMIDPYQVYLARHYGADAILLMLSVLNDEQYGQLANIAHELGMGILTEVSNEEELQRAIALKAKVIGINNRNLRDLSTDLNRTKQLAPQLPKECIVISESGIYNHQQVRDLSQFANGFLIGSSLMSQDNVEQAVRKVILGENKVCGLTHADDAVKAYQAGAVYGGLIFVEQSKRYVDKEAARLTMSGAPLLYVGVFQNHPIDQIVELANELNLTAVQLHGDEDQTYIDALRTRLPEQVTIWKAYGVAETVPPLLKHVERHLLDTKVGAQTGGTGQTFDWQLITQPQHIMLAGGITPDNVKLAASIGCLGVDLNSGVESEPGKKDAAKLQQAFSAIREY